MSDTLFYELMSLSKMLPLCEKRSTYSLPIAGCTLVEHIARRITSQNNKKKICFIILDEGLKSSKNLLKILENYGEVLH